MKLSEKTLTRRTFLAGSAVAAAGAGLAMTGCGSSDSTSGDETAASGGGELTGAIAYQGSDYTPASTSQALPLAANRHVLEGLYDLHLADYSAYNGLAAGEPTQISDTEYEVTIRDGATFSDGTAVTADDVVESYNRAVAGGMYTPMLSWVSAMTAKDDSTVSITTAYPFSLIKERLSLIKVAPASMSDEDLQTMPIGSGPWVYDTITEEQVTFLPNENYNGDYPALDESMRWDVIVDDTARTTATTEGTVQVMENVPADVISQVEAAGCATEDVQGFSLPFLMFNTQREPFDDARVRQAFFYAIDVDKLIQNSLSGQASTAKSFLPENHANFHEASTVYTYDPDRARELLDEAGVDSLSITLDMTNASWITALAASIREDLLEVGIDATLRENVSATLYANYADTGEYDVVLAPGDPSVFGNDPDLLMNWWYGDNSWTRQRTFWYGTPEYEELHTLMQSAVEASGDEQQEYWNQCFDLLSEQVPLYPLLHRKVTTAWYADQLNNFEPIGTTGLDFIGVSTASA